MTKINIDSKGSLAKLMATENLTVQHKKVPTASFDVKNRVLNLPIWEDMSNTMYDGLIGHEVGHALYTPYEEWKDFVSENPNLKDYANVIEDARIERMMKTKFPGMKKVFFGMYDELNMKDFFGIGNKDVNEYGILDRINLFFKLGVRVDLEFTPEEMVFVNRADNTKTFQDVLDLTLDLAEYAKNEELNTDFDDMGDYDFDDSEDGDESNPMPSMPGDDEKEEGEEAEGSGPNGKESDGDSDGEDGQDVNAEGSGGEGEELPGSETQKNFDDKMDGLNDEFASNPIYVDLPNTNIDDVTIGYKKTAEIMNEHFTVDSNYTRYYEDEGIQNRKDIEDEICSWKKDTLSVVNYMVKEFEMKQSASAHRRTSVGKTGVLDTNKMHAYKYEEDIFKRVATIKDGKNHGLVMYVDWSGSMSDKLLATVKQTITLVMFAKKVGIPFRVYSFSNSSGLSKYYKNDNTVFYGDNDSGNFGFDHLVLGRVSMLEFFNEKMNAREFKNGIDNFYKLAIAAGWDSKKTIIRPDGFGLASTPLNEAIIGSFEMVEKFKRETGREKINVIWLTDGASDGNDRYYNAECKWTKDGIRGWGDDRQHMVVRDPKTRKYIAEQKDYNDLTPSLLTALGDRCGVNVIGFFLTDVRSINNKIDRTMGWEKTTEAKKKVRQTGYSSFVSGGYDKYFMINSTAMDKEVTMPEEVEKDKNGGISKAKLRTAFKKFSKGRKVNKMLLNEFVAMVA
jgi:hypothetical protein